MTFTTRCGRAHRVGVGATLVAVHLLLAMILIRTRTPTDAVPGAPTPIVPLVAAIHVVARPLPPVPPPAPLDAPIDVALVPPEIEVAAPAAAPPPACDPLSALAAAFTAAAPALAAPAAPPRTIMLWNGSWASDPEARSLQPIAVATLRRLPPACLDETLVGPRLIFLAAGGAPVSIAFGSGTWRWQDLLSSD